jgi:hypothetical protein
MSCIPSTRRTQLLERLNKKQAQLTQLYTAYDDMILKGEIKGYSFNSGEGAQTVTYRTTAQIETAISNLEASIDSITRTLNNTGNPNMNVRRY